MSVKITPYLLLVFLFCSFIVFGQEEEISIELPTVIGPSPEVAALAKYLDFPVNHASGIPNIEIPIHQLSEGDIRVPVSLNYHAGGIKVSETATTVGLGWNLTAGGVVSRMIKHHPDDLSGVGYMHNSFYSAGDIPIQEGLKDHYFNNHDTEPDIFFFNFMGYSGKFQYYKNPNNPSDHSFFHLTDNNVKIDFESTSNGNIDKFILTTPDGTKYYFGKNNSGPLRTAMERTSSRHLTHSHKSSLSSEISTGNFVTAWYLLEIESVTGHKVDFFYESPNSLIIEGTLDSQKYLTKKNPGCGISIQGNNDFYISTNFSEQSHLGPRLKSIHSSIEKIELEYDTQDRQDLPGSKKLNKIKIKNNKNDALVKEFILNHDYFISDAPSPTAPDYFYYNYSVGSKQSRLRRLKLISVTEKAYEGSYSTSLPPYIFEYNTSVKLPHKFSFAQDLWGYYNGKDQNGSLVPKAIINGRTFSQSPPFQTLQEDADRHVDPVKSQAGVLTKIIYPTGGYTKYTYENNTVSGILGSTLERRMLFGNQIQEKYKHFTKSHNGTHEFTFEVGEFLSGLISVKIEHELLGIGSFIFKLYNAQQQEIQNWQAGDLNLPSGQYTIKAIPQGFGELKDFDIYMKWKQEIIPEIVYTGGLRIKEILKNDGINTVLQKEYDYKRNLKTDELQVIQQSGMNANRISSGIIGWWPQVVYDNYQYTFSENCCGQSVVLMTSYPQKSLFEYSGSSTMYNQVTEWTIDVQTQDQYKTEYFFDGEPVNIYLDYSKPKSYVFQDIYRGNLLKKTEYNTAGNKKREETYTYDQIDLEKLIDFGVEIIASTNLTAFSPQECLYVPLHEKYYRNKHLLRPKTSSTTEFFPSGNLTTEKEYFYESSNGMLPSKTETTYYGQGSQAKKVETILKYPFDFPSDTQMQSLVAQNRIGSPVEVQQKIDGTLVNTSKIIYGSNAQTSGHLLPVKIQAAKGNNSLEDRVSFDRYDSKGNILQVSKAGSGSTKIAYVWDASGNYPLAKIFNKTYTSIGTGLINNIHTASQGSNETALKNALNALRTTYKNDPVLIDTYTYHPLFGMTSVTDPSGISTYYEYDGFGRLNTIKDHNQNRLQSYAYNYDANGINNYVLTGIYKNASGSDYQLNTTYVDGLGRPVQEIAHGQSGLGNDLVTPIAYDGFGRAFREYLPYDRGSSSQSKDTDALSKALTFYNTSYFDHTTNPYTETLYEDSPLNRVLKEAAPGNDWQMGSGHEIKFDYDTNKNNEVYYFGVNYSGETPSLKLIKSGAPSVPYYAAKELYKTITKDENHQGTTKIGTTEEFKNKLGQVVLKRNWNAGGTNNNTAIALDTYYVYDVYGNLIFVLPPLLSEQIVSANNLVSNHNSLIDKLGYRYRYDHRNRMIHKKLPGRQTEYIAYDPLDRPVAVGPVKSPFLNQDNDGMLHTRYDAFDRVVHTSWAAATNINETFRKNIENSITTKYSETPLSSPQTKNGLLVHYTSTVAPPANRQFLTTNLYDEYPNWVTDFSSVLGQTPYYNQTQKPKGMETAQYVRVLENTSHTAHSRSYSLYDYKQRAIRQHTQNHLGGYTQTDQQYDFIGKVLQTQTKHKRTAQDEELKIEENFAYTPEDRLLSHTHKINSGDPETLSLNEYDPLGQLMTKKVGKTGNYNYLQHINYTYNIRGWLTNINSVGSLAGGLQTPQDLFAFRINYNTLSNAHPDVEPLYNGNISQTFWRTANDNILRSYGYVYDPLNRLLDAFYIIPNSSVTDSYNEHLTYDSNGNILTLKRNGKEETEQQVFMIDDLDYEYDGNQLKNVTDDTAYSEGFDDGNKHQQTNQNDFEYDAYGNMIIDRNKIITEITYNHLNLPKKISFGTSGTIEYFYNANGEKLKKKLTSRTIVKNIEYLNGFQYEDENLSFFPTAEGYVKVTETGTVGKVFSYVYNHTDHLGNIRLRYTRDPEEPGKVRILEENSYYPFGMKHEGYNNEHEIILPPGHLIPYPPVKIMPITPFDTDPYQYKYQGQERQNEFRLNWDSFKWRNYDYAIGRFFNVDPIAEDYISISPYQFAHNNPVWKIELEGLEGIPASGDDLLNKESNNQHPGRQAIPIGDSSVSNYGSIFQTVSYEGPSVIASYPGEAMDDLVTEGVQWIASKLMGSDVSAETAGNIQLGTELIITAASKGKNAKNVLSNSKIGTRRKNRLPDKGEPNSMKTNKSGTTIKKYGADGNVQKEYNKGHQGSKTPKVEKSDHVHDYKPNPHHPEGKPTRMPGRPLKPNEISKDRFKTKK